MKKLILIIFLVIVFGIGTIIYINKANYIPEKVFYEPEYNSDIIKNINTFEISNDKIKNKYQFVYISDVHMSVINENEEDEQIKQNLEERQKLFNGDGPKSEEIFKEIIKYTNNKNADALLMGGDIVDTPAESNMNFLKESLKELKTKYLYVFGNHDWTFLWDYQSPEMEAKYVPMFKDIMDDTDVSYLEYEDLIILGINNGKETIEEKSLEKIKNVLEKNKPTIVMMHIPMATDYLIEENKKYRPEKIKVLGEGGVELDETTKKAFDMILSDKYNVFYILSGHIHIKMEDNINSEIYEIVSAPAFTGNMNVIKINN